MAELINLQTADRHLKLLTAELDKLRKSLEDPNKGVWSDAQRGELASVHTAISHLTNALTDLVHNNRDGRGTPPARGTLNSMMDRAR